ncbi:MAG: BtrH N-terminal domain-containing protein [Clostridiaceae bacterium]|nr:BtrH N-terminal domain-containing protein [Clostridiaceae bacterium]
MCEKRLPTNYPITTTYPVDANAAMIISNQKEYNVWLLNSFIQISSRVSSHPITYFDFHYRNCPLLYLQKINKKLINTQEYDKLIYFLINAIDNGYYIYLIINRKYIKAYLTEKDSRHDMLIYGYNLDKYIFYIADTFQNGKYSFETCTFNELFEAVNNLSEEDNYYMGFNNSIELLSLKKYPEEALFNLRRVKESIIDYLECRPTKYWYTQQFNWHNPMNNHLLGLDCYKLIYKELEYIIENRVISHTGWLSFHVMWEHKNIMLKRLYYLNENKMLNNSQDVISEYHDIERKTLLYRNQIIKYAYTVQKDDSIMKSLFKKYKEIEFCDRNIIETITKCIIG